ncbi:MAG TPA: AAA family ATPase [Casimicrobiaceae bacterium]|nr:AAA family ATPase [Casimicrobiaceae bacterium]
MHDFHDLRLVLRSRVALVVVETHEEPKVVGEAERIAREAGLPFHLWTAADGLVHRTFSWQSARADTRFGRADGTVPAREPPSRPDAIEGTEDLRAALAHVDRKGEPGLYVLCDPHPFLEDPVVLRRLREIALAHGERARTLVLVAPRLTLPPELARLAARLVVPVPDAEGVRAILKSELDLYAAQAGQRARGDSEAAQLLVTHLTGLAEDDVRRLARHAIRDDGLLDRADVGRLVQAKRELAGGAGLELVVDAGSLDDVAGMATLKGWLAQRKAVFTGAPNAPPLDPPRGVLLLGVQGAGKSLAAKAIAGAWGVPLLRLDVGALYSKWAGETERQLRDALAAAERMAPSVVWIDEIEKGLASGSDDADGGVSRRVLASLLTWMAERRARVFLVATANDIERLPPELMRKGRFDEIFFVDLPAPDVREAIFRLHLARRGADPAAFDLRALARASDGFSGAEIEQAIVAALYGAHAQGAPLDTAQLAAALAATRPLSVIMAERIAALRDWARSRTVPA